MNLKHHLMVAAVLMGAGLASTGLLQVRAAQAPILSYCPTHAGAVDCATAVQLLLQFSKPSDDELVTIFNTIVAQLSVGHHSRAAYNNTVQALAILAGAISDAGQRAAATDLIQKLAANEPPAPASVGSEGDFKGTGRNPSSSSSSGGSTNGLTSGVMSSGGTSGSCGQTSGDVTSSGASGGTSGSSGQTSGDVTSSGASGGTSGSSGQTSGDVTSSGASGGTSGSIC